MGDTAKGHAVPFNPWLSEAMPVGGAACVLGFTGGGVTPRPQKPPVPCGERTDRVLVEMGGGWRKAIR